MNTDANTTNSGTHSWKCCKCNAELTAHKVVLEYMGHTIQHEVPACKKCGRVCISKELAEGRMHEVEETLEDK